MQSVTGLSTAADGDDDDDDGGVGGGDDADDDGVMLAKYNVERVKKCTFKPDKNRSELYKHEYK